MSIGKKSQKHNVTLGSVLAMAALVLLAVYVNGQSSDVENTLSEQQAIEASQLMQVVVPDGVPQQLVSYEGMDVNFNSLLHIPNYVVWELTGNETHGDVPRYNKFMNDPDVNGCPDTWDYNYSGYDRGHMAPAADMKWSREAMKHTFYLSNICPQAKALNTGAWNRLESNCRKWAQRDSALIIVCGPVISDKMTEFIGDSRVAVPKRFFKVVLAPYSHPMRGIGFIMPNDRVEGGMQAAAVSIDSVESVTGYDFFSALPDEVEAAVESQCDFYKWSAHK
ncbi:MAG: DNA/RNA non-specific endonuclease [Paramuribaculum sp.]|nr:DNA/RNA non-specific endonuclease [Paramuribaculum sp.]